LKADRRAGEAPAAGSVCLRGVRGRRRAHVLRAQYALPMSPL